jgi:hypothetical protein
MHLTDAVALLQLAEHIMFVETFSVSDFELSDVREKTSEIASVFSARGLTTYTANSRILHTQSFSEAEYAGACDNAVPAILEDIALLDLKKIRQGKPIGTFGTRPLGIRSPAMKQWISRGIPAWRRKALAECALQEKAKGAIHYIVSSYDEVYCGVQQVAHRMDPQLAETLAAVLVEPI